MKLSPQTDTRLAHVAELIDGMPIAMLTTTAADGTLSSRPMATMEMDGSGAIWFFTDLRSAKVAHLGEANLSFADAAKGRYVSLSGQGEIATDAAHVQRLWSAAAKPWFPQGPESPNLALLKFTPATADYWDAPSSAMVRAFGVVASMVAGKPVAMGTHGSHTGLSEGVAGA